MENKIITWNGQDYKLVPVKKIKTEEDYLKGHRASGLKVGDKVKVLRDFKDKEGGANTYWHECKSKMIGNEYIVYRDENKDGFLLKQQNGMCWQFPYFVLEKVEEPEKKEVKSYEDVVNELRSCSPSKEKHEQSFARTQLENVATYLNEIEFKDVEWGITYNYLYSNLDKIGADSSFHYYFSGRIQFKTKEVAQRAIQILGEETIKLALK